MVLLAMSVVFYALAGLSAAVYVAVSIVSIYTAARALGKVNDTRHKRLILWSAMAVNIGILFFMKYYNYLALNAFSGHLPQLSDLIVPLGLSFYTFQSVGYLLDVYWEKTEPETNIAKYALFVLFFPQIIQGPIGRYSHLQPQLTEGHDFQYDRFKKGLILILWGLFKKMVIANRLIRLVDPLFDDPGSNNGFMVVIALGAYSIQQYTDFSGGIDLITGIAELFGIEMAPNFKRPYFSSSLSEFWRRWHISLGAWMKDYVFYPIAMTKTMDRICKFFSKKGGIKAYLGVQMFLCNVTVFLLVGIWHGPYLHYVYWGLYNGLIIGIESVIKPIMDAKRAKKGITKPSTIRKLLAILGTFLIVNFGWFFDRAPSMENAGIMIKKLFTDFHPFGFTLSWLNGFGLMPNDYFIVAYGVILMLIVSLYDENHKISMRDRLVTIRPVTAWPLIYILLFTYVAFATSPEGAAAFMYAQF